MSKDGGPAFPKPPVMHRNEDGKLEYFGTQIGMSLRDWFAGMALQGLLASVTEDEEVIDDVIARSSYELADAMLAARERGE